MPVMFSVVGLPGHCRGGFLRVFRSTSRPQVCGAHKGNVLKVLQKVERAMRFQ